MGLRVLRSVIGFSLMLAVSLPAQTTFGVIRGRVLDPTGLAVAKALVTVTNINTNVQKAAVCDDTGSYEVGYLQPGAYKVEAKAAGFKRFVAEGVQLNANATVLVEANLEVGEVSTSITVTGGALAITTESAVIGDVKTQQQYLEAPLNVRGNWDSYIFTYMSLVPGAQPADTSYSITLAGVRVSAANYTVDGISTADPLYGGVMGPANPSMDFIKEVDVQFSGNSAEFRAPGQVTLVTRGGENGMHGSLFWYYNTAGLNARDFFASRKGFNVMNDFGGAVSGPIFKNKTFYSGSFEGFNLHNAAVLNLNLPSKRVRGGDFSMLKDGKGNPIVLADPFGGGVFPGAVIPNDRLNATALKIQSRFYPIPNFGNPESVVSNYNDVVKQTQRKEQVDVRIDHQISANNSLFGRFDAMRAPNAALEGGMPTIGFRIQRRQTRNFLLSDTHIFRPTLINEFRFGISRNFNPRSGPINGPDIVKELGLTNLAPDLPALNAMPVFSISGYQGISQIAYNTPAGMNYEWQDNLSWIRGRHTVKIGTEVRRHYAAIYTVSPTNAFGSIGFTGAYTNYAYSDFLLGIPRSASRTVSGFVRDHRTNLDTAFFAQDDFKVSSRLTLTLGLRYELNPPFVEKEDRASNFDPVAGRLVVPTSAAQGLLNSAFVASKLVPIITADQAGLPRSLAFTDKNNFAPRVGFAYKLTADNKTVLRGAWGVFYDLFGSPLWNGLGGGPYAGSASTPPNAIANGVALWQLPAMFPANLNLGSTASLTVIDPHIRTPYIQQWNLTLEREIWHTGFRASYMGVDSLKIPIIRDINQVLPSAQPFNVNRRPYPQLGSVVQYANGGTEFYNGLILSVDRKFRNGFQFQASHTWAKDLTNDHSTGQTGYQLENAYDRDREWGNQAYTRRHRFIFNAIFELPFGEKHKLASSGLMRRLAGGWSFSFFGLMQTGQYFTPTYSGSDPANVGTSGGRPDRIAAGTISNPTIAKWFDPTAFQVPPNGRFGNAGNNILAGPGTRVLNMGLFKQIHVTERMRFQLEGTFTNILNHPNFGVPNALITSSSVGIIQASQTFENAGPRTTRVGLRMDW